MIGRFEYSNSSISITHKDFAFINKLIFENKTNGIEATIYISKHPELIDDAERSNKMTQHYQFIESYSNGTQCEMREGFNRSTTLIYNCDPFGRELAV
jgi:hypothetical protein